jgi:hypothetical protein
MARVALYTPALKNPPLYGGAKNLVAIQFVAPGTASLPASDGLPTGWDSDQFASGVIRYGDVIEINGTRYKLMSDTNDNGASSYSPAFYVTPAFDSTNVFFANNTGYLASRGVVQIVAQPVNDSGQMINVKYDNDGNALGTVPSSAAPYWTDPASYKILRQPMKTSAEPLQLPEGSAIDLRASGLGDAAFFYIGPTALNSQGVDNSDDILIMFAPEGRVSRLALNQNGLPITPPKPPFDEPVVDNIFLLVGKRENAPPPPVSGTPHDPTLVSAEMMGKTDAQMKDLKKAVNWLRGESRWVVIGSQSGRVVTVENSYVDPRAIINTKPGTVSESTEELRTLQIIGTSQTPGAREFIKEMKQLGGR